MLTAAGSTGIACERVEADQVWGGDGAGARAFMAAWGPVKHHMDLAGPDDAARARDALAGALARFASPGGARTRGTAWLVTARRQGLPAHPDRDSRADRSRLPSTVV